MKYINSLVSMGAKNVSKNQLRTGNQVQPPFYKGRGMNEMDAYLLSLIKRINLGSKAKATLKPVSLMKKTKYSGKGLKLVR